MSFEQNQVLDSADNRPQSAKDGTSRLVNMLERDPSAQRTSAEQNASVVDKHGEMTVQSAYSDNATSGLNSNNSSDGSQGSANSLSNDLGYLSSAAHMIASQASMLSKDVTMLNNSATGDSGVTGALMKDIAQIGKVDSQFLADLSQLFDGAGASASAAGASGSKAGDSGSGASGSKAGDCGSGASGSKAGDTGSGASGSTAGDTGSGASGSTAGDTGSGNTGSTSTTGSGGSGDVAGTTTIYNNGTGAWNNENYDWNATTNYNTAPDGTPPPNGATEVATTTLTGAWGGFQPYAPGDNQNITGDNYLNIELNTEGQSLSDFNLGAMNVGDKPTGKSVTGTLSQYETGSSGNWVDLSVPLSALGLGPNDAQSPNGMYKFGLQDNVTTVGSSFQVSGITLSANPEQASAGGDTGTGTTGTKSAGGDTGTSTTGTSTAGGGDTGTSTTGTSTAGGGDTTGTTTSGGDTGSTSTTGSGAPGDAAGTTTVYYNGNGAWNNENYDWNATTNYNTTPDGAPPDGASTVATTTLTGDWGGFQPYAPGDNQNITGDNYLNIELNTEGQSLSDFNLGAMNVGDKPTGKGITGGLSQYETGSSGNWVDLSVPLSALGLGPNDAQSPNEMYKFGLQDNVTNVGATFQVSGISLSANPEQA